jgi:hypothetical protein
MRKIPTAAGTLPQSPPVGEGGIESLSDGKHGDLRGGLSSLSSLRALCPGLVGTAGYSRVQRVRLSAGQPEGQAKRRQTRTSGGVGPVAGWASAQSVAGTRFALVFRWASVSTTKVCQRRVISISTSVGTVQFVSKYW